MSLSSENFNENQKKIIGILLKKYEESKTYFGENKIKQRFSCRPSNIYDQYYSDYADLDVIEQIKQDILDLEKSGLITVERDEHDISCIYAVTERYEYYCNIIGIKGKKQILNEFETIFSSFLGKSKTLDNLCYEQLKKIRAHKDNTLTNDPNELIKILNCIEYIESNTIEIMERELSIQLFSDSKIFEKKYKGKVCTQLANYGDYRSLIENEDDKNLRNAIILSTNNVVQNPTYIYFKGDGILKYKDETYIKLSYEHPVAILSKDLKNIDIISVYADSIITIENLTSYNRLDFKNAFSIYLSGYNNHAKSDFLRLIYNCNNNKKWYHFGDIDPDGILILKNLRATTGIFFEEYKMGISELKQYNEYLKPLNNNDIVKAKSLQTDKEFGMLVKYMIENNCKLEQEIISWKES